MDVRRHSGAHFELVKSAPLVDCDRDDPADCEKSYDKIAKCAEVIVKTGDSIPESSFQMKTSGQESENLDASDDERDDYRDACDRDVVVELANGLYEGPSVRAQHEDVVRGIDERHSCRKEYGEHEDRPKRQAPRRFGSGNPQ